IPIPTPLPTPATVVCEFDNPNRAASDAPFLCSTTVETNPESGPSTHGIITKEEGGPIVGIIGNGPTDAETGGAEHLKKAPPPIEGLDKPLLEPPPTPTPETPSKSTAEAPAKPTLVALGKIDHRGGNPSSHVPVPHGAEVVRRHGHSHTFVGEHQDSGSGGGNDGGGDAGFGYGPCGGGAGDADHTCVEPLKEKEEKKEKERAVQGTEEKGTPPDYGS
ncbi:hypothetical protein FPV67DRAFT_1649096, partial [Lyophyllum atratum]